jgi:hypothetical protein
VARIKTAVAVRLNPDLLAEVRQSAERDSRSRTNFIETALRERINGTASARRQVGSARVLKDNKNQ